MKIMTNRLRNTLFALVIITFAIVAPILVLYTFGYRIERDPWSLRQTAFIAINFQPDNAQIFLDGKLLEEKQDKMVITNLSRGKYDVTLKKDGYFDWAQTFLTEPGEVTWAEQVILFAKEPAQETILSLLESDQFQTSSDKSHVAILRTDAETSSRTIDFYETRTYRQNTSILIDDVHKQLPDAEQISFDSAFYTADEDWFILPYQTKNELSKFIAINENDMTLSKLSEQVPEATEFFASPNDSILYYFNDDSKYTELNVSTGQETTYEDTILSFTHGLREYRIAKKDDSCTLQGGNSFLDEFLDIENIECSRYAVTTSPRNMIALRNIDSGDLFVLDVNAASLTKIAENTEHMYWASSPREEDVLTYSTGEELGAYINAEEPLNTTLTRLSSRIEDFLPHPSGSHVYFITSDNLNAIETDDFSVRNIHTWDQTLPFMLLLPGTSSERVVISSSRADSENQNQLELIELTMYEK